MRYRIIKECNGVGDVTFEVHFYKPVKWLLGLRHKWQIATETVYRMEFSYNRYCKFQTFEEAQAYVDKHNIKRTLESMGEIDSEGSYKV